MSTILYNKKCYPISDTDSVLDALLKHDVDYPYSCKIGTCQSCLTKLVDGEISSEAQKGLKPTLAAKNYFLACQCKPKSNITIALPSEEDTSIFSKIIGLAKLNHNVLQVRLSIDNPHLFKAGQYINLVGPDNLIRSYSIANVPKEYIELHVKLMPNGLMSCWLNQYAKIGLSICIREPMGNCFYHNPENQSFPIVLAGTGTGLAPLIGIAGDALKNNHNGKIVLIHGGLNETDLYLHKELSALQNKYDNFHYMPCVLNENSMIQQASIELVLIQNLKGIASSVRLFICGPEETTKKIKLKAFLAGVPSGSIYSDSFVTAR